MIDTIIKALLIMILFFAFMMMAAMAVGAVEALIEYYQDRADGSAKKKGDHHEDH